jgi:hypothetical protein
MREFYSCLVVFDSWILPFNESFFKKNPRLMLPLGKDNNHSSAFSLNKKGNNFSFTIALSISLNFCVSLISQKSGRCIEIFSLALSLNRSLHILPPFQEISGKNLVKFDIV